MPSKYITLLKQTLNVSYEYDEEALIDEVVTMLSKRIEELSKYSDHREQVLLMSSLGILVEQLKLANQTDIDLLEMSSELDRYQHSVISLNETLKAALDS